MTSRGWRNPVRPRELVADSECRLMWALPQSRIWTCQKTAWSYREHVVRSETEVAMRGYGQFCPVAKGAEVFAERWTPLVLRELLCGSTHFSDLHAAFR